MWAISATAASNTASVAGDVFCTPLILRTYWRAAASISSGVATGSSPRSVVMLRHMSSIVRSPSTTVRRTAATDAAIAFAAMTTRFDLRLARVADGPTLQHIERAAGEQFRSIGMANIADDEPPSLERLAFYATTGRSWVATVADPAHGGNAIVGYCLADLVGRNAHLEQISVLPQWQGRGVARQLLDVLRAWAASRGLAGITLTTFEHVPWNAPLYEHLGFRVLADDEVGPELRALRDEESMHGLGPATRVCMLMPL